MPLAPGSRPAALASPGPALLKSVLDRLLAAVLLVCTVPWLLLVALVIWSTDDGPLLDRRPVAGRERRRFAVLRLRTLPPAGHGSSPVRELVRRTCLDELLQLVNVLRGDMALVGPRAVSPDRDDRPDGDVRLLLRPGLVGLRHLPGTLGSGDERAVAERYVREWSPLLDLRSLVRAVRSIGV
ncbi:sugar transferase [Geodermatophilus nigrescens]